jgi:hypothetical protein
MDRLAGPTHKTKGRNGPRHADAEVEHRAFEANCLDGPGHQGCWWISPQSAAGCLG